MPKVQLRHDRDINLMRSTLHEIGQRYLSTEDETRGIRSRSSDIAVALTHASESIFNSVLGEVNVASAHVRGNGSNERNDHSKDGNGGGKDHSASNNGGGKDHSASSNGGGKDHSASSNGGGKDHSASSKDESEWMEMVDPALEARFEAISEELGGVLDDVHDMRVLALERCKARLTEAVKRVPALNDEEDDAGKKNDERIVDFDVDAKSIEGARNEWNVAVAKMRGLDNLMLDTLAKAGKVSAAVRSGIAARRSKFENALVGSGGENVNPAANGKDTLERLGKARGNAGVRKRPY